MNHPHLIHSKALEIFLISQTKDEFNLRSKEFDKKLKKTLKIDRVMTKKSFEYITSKENPLKNLKVAGNKIDMKISKMVREYYTEFSNKMACYENTFQEIENLSLELSKLMTKVTIQRLYFIF